MGEQKSDLSLILQILPQNPDVLQIDWNLPYDFHRVTFSFSDNDYSFDIHIFQQVHFFLAKFVLKVERNCAKVWAKDSCNCCNRITSFLKWSQTHNHGKNILDKL